MICGPLYLWQTPTIYMFYSSGEIFARMEISMVTHLQLREIYPSNFLLGALQAFQRMLIYMNSRLLVQVP
jgi:hypothetical protein